MDLIGKMNHHLEWYQMGIRTIIVFVLAITMLRVAGRRTFGQNTTFDVVVGVILGGILSRSITGEVPFWESIFAGSVLVILHRVLGILIFNSKSIQKAVQGEHYILFENGRTVHKNMRAHSITTEDLLESIRTTANLEDLDEVDKAYEECTGRISVIKKKV